MTHQEGMEEEETGMAVNFSLMKPAEEREPEAMKVEEPVMVDSPMKRSATARGPPPRGPRKIAPAPVVDMTRMMIISSGFLCDFSSALIFSLSSQFFPFCL